jgi:transposase-like protein
MSAIDAFLAALCLRYTPKLSIADWQAFNGEYGTEEDAVAFLFETKWPDGFRCPRCNYNHAYVIRSRKLPLYQCKACCHQTSLTAGTVMENSRTPMRKWLTAFFLASRTECGINASQLQARINVTYKTAWSMLHVIRLAINEADTKQALSGTVMAGIGFGGQSLTIKPQSKEKPILVGASIDKQEQPIFIKMKLVQLEHIENKYLKHSGINAFKEKHIKNGTEGAQFLQRFAFSASRPIKDLFDQTMFRLTRTFKGLGSRHLQLYLDEACYRINQTLQGKPIFKSLSRLCMSTPRYGTRSRNLVSNP